MHGGDIASILCRCGVFVEHRELCEYILSTTSGVKKSRKKSTGSFLSMCMLRPGVAVKLKSM